MFEDLLRIRRFREQSAANAVVRAKALVAEREQAVRDAEAAVVEFHGHRRAEEARLFEEIRGMAVKLEKLEDMKQSVALMRERELELEEAVEDARKAVVTAEEEHGKAVEVHRQALRALEKFKEFVEVQKAAARNAAARKEETETEEVTEAAYAAHKRGAT